MLIGSIERIGQGQLSTSQMDAKKNYRRKEKFELEDDLELLSLMLEDSRTQPSLYQPGPYWNLKTKIIVNEIKRCGLGGFRGSTNLIGLSYADNIEIDIRNSMNFSLKSQLAQRIMKTYPMKIVFDKQVQWTRRYADQNMIYAQEVLNLKGRTHDLLKKYRVPYSLLGNCQTKVKIGGRDHSIHYLNLLEQHDNVSSRVKFSAARSVFEIGGGFGANIHLLLQNYKNIKKILYLDIPPNLYVGTQYLRAIYGAAVYDYRDLKDLDSIKFSPDNKTQIFCIAPWQIEKFASPIDILINSHSFVEMPSDVVRNYVDRFFGFPKPKNSAIVLTTYDGFDLKTTLDPNKLPKFFKGRKFDYFKRETLLDPSRDNLYFVSPGSFSCKSQRKNDEQN